jgi:hypothetical protein
LYLSLGVYTSAQEWLKKDSNGTTKMAEIYHHENNIIYTVGSFADEDKPNGSYVWAKSEEGKG